MHKLGICSVTFRKKTTDEIIEATKKAGLSAIEWGGDVHVPLYDLENAKSVGDQTREAGLEVSSYGSYYYAGQEEDFQPVLDTARALGTDSIRIWAKKMDFKKEIGKINEAEFAKVVKDIKNAAKLAQLHGVSLHIEFHQGTYTDSTESAQRLMNEVNEPNVFLYWQPLAYLSHEERLEQIKELHFYISNVHVFYWDSEFKRYPLVDGTSAWKEYIHQIQMVSPNSPYFLMEFVRDNVTEQFEEDAETFIGWFSS